MQNLPLSKHATLHQKMNIIYGVLGQLMTRFYNVFSHVNTNQVKCYVANFTQKNLQISINKKLFKITFDDKSTNIISIRQM